MNWNAFRWIKEEGREELGQGIGRENGQSKNSYQKKTKTNENKYERETESLEQEYTRKGRKELGQREREKEREVEKEREYTAEENMKSE